MEESFMSYIKDLKRGEKVRIDPYLYGDFLRFVDLKGGELRQLFIKKMNRRTVECDDVYPVLIEVWFD